MSVKSYRSSVGGYFICRTTTDNESCGYSAFGITREQAYLSICENLPQVHDLLKPVIREMLKNQAFILYCQQYNLTNTELLSQNFIAYQQAVENHITIDQQVIDTFDRYADDPIVVQAYLDYDIRNKKIDEGWSHPAVLQAIAHLKSIELYIWQLNGNQELEPHKHYHHYSLKPNQRLDLLFINNGNHFEQLECLNYKKLQLKELKIRKKSLTMQRKHIDRLENKTLLVSDYPRPEKAFNLRESQEDIKYKIYCINADLLKLENELRELHKVLRMSEVINSSTKPISSIEEDNAEYLEIIQQLPSLFQDKAEKEILEQLKHLDYRVLKILGDTKQNSNSLWLLSYACQKGYLLVVEFLVESAKVDPKIKGVHELTPLHFACGNGHLPIVQYLIETIKVDPEIKGESDRAPLHFACIYGHFSIVEYLIETAGVDPQIRDQNHLTPLHFACRNGYLPIVKYLTKLIKASQSIAKSYTVTPGRESEKNVPLFGNHQQYGDFFPSWAAENIFGFLDYKTLTSVTSRINKTWYQFTKDYLTNHPEHKIMPQIKSKDGLTPLHLACAHGHLLVTQYLVETANAHPIVRGKTGLTPLHLACAYGHFSTVKYLVETAKVNPQIKNENDLTPLHLACNEGHFSIVQYLVEIAKVDLQVKDGSNMTPQDRAKNNNHLGIVYWLELYILTQSKFIDVESLAQLFEKINSYRAEGKILLRFHTFYTYLKCLLNDPYVWDKNQRILIRGNWLKGMEPDDQKKLLMLSIEIGDAGICKLFKNLDLQILQLNTLEINRERANCLKIIFKQNANLKELLFYHITLVNTGYQIFLEAVDILKKRLEILVLHRCGLTHEQILLLVPRLNFKKLQKLDLEGNYLRHESLELLLKEMKKLDDFDDTASGLEISLRDNRIEIPIIARLEELSNLIGGNTRLRALHLEGNLLESEKRNKLFIELFRSLLKKSELTVETLLQSKFGSFEREPNYNHQYQLLIITPEGNETKIRFTYQEITKFTEFRTSIKGSVDNEVWDYIKKIELLFLPNSMLKANASDKVLCKKVIDFHPESPLKSRLSIHPLFKSPSLESAKSLFIPEQRITLQDWRIYLLAQNKGEHSLIAYEGLRNYGQRFFKVAHLQALNKGRFERAEMIVSFKSSDARGIHGLIQHLKRNHIWFELPAKRNQINELHKLIREDMDNQKAVNERYKYKTVVLGSTMQSKAAKNEEITNCTKWMFDKIKAIGFEMTIDFKLLGYIPSLVIKKLQSEKGAGRNPIRPRSEEVISSDVLDDNDNKRDQSCNVM